VGESGSYGECCLETVRIENQELLIQRFGRWPSFHDAEIVRARFDREGVDAPYMECDIHVFEMTDEVDSRGCYVLKNHTLVTLRFCRVGLESFEGWNGQNVLFDLKIRPAEPGDSYEEDLPIEVELSASYGCSAWLKCTVIKVLRAEEFKMEPGGPDGGQGRT